jgi:hypothetical protein
MVRDQTIDDTAMDLARCDAELAADMEGLGLMSPEATAGLIEARGAVTERRTGPTGSGRMHFPIGLHRRNYSMSCNFAPGNDRIWPPVECRDLDTQHPPLIAPLSARSNHHVVIKRGHGQRIAAISASGVEQGDVPPSSP